LLIDKKDNSIFDIHFLTKNGEVKQIKQAAKVSIPVDREVVEAYHINEDGSNKEPLIRVVSGTNLITLGFSVFWISIFCKFKIKCKNNTFFLGT